MLALEDGGEDHQGLELAGAIHQGHRHGALRVAAVLVRGNHHAAAVVTPVHGGSQPDLLEFVGLAVYRDDGVAGLEVEQQALDGDAGVIDGLIGGLAELVAHLTAVAVDAEADVVEEAAGLALDGDGGQVLQVFLDGKGRTADLLVQVLQKVIAAADGVVEDIVGNGQTLRVVDKTVKSAVAAGNDHAVFRPDFGKKRCVTVQLGHVAEAQLRVHVQPARFFLTQAIARIGVEQNVVFHM